ncbi:hypothetical protein NQ315_003927 [Exocentrus adspersus]|uniref:Uncharacterized protein n=1 Tax=Exocentrus adspersus TaxID=1586481 RepID=A0AAV8VYF0_9CUCU|nr:hypothetical protein NQ315_003927 [Exocentrus adspersus]
MKLPIDLIHGKPLTEDDEGGDRTTLPEFVASLEERLKTVHEFARNRLLLTSDRMKMLLDMKPGQNVFKEGDAVWLYQPQRKKGLSPKLQRPWESLSKNEIVIFVNKSATLTKILKPQDLEALMIGQRSVVIGDVNAWFMTKNSNSIRHT